MLPLSAGEAMNVQVKAHYRQSPIPAELSIDHDGSVRAAYLEPRQTAAPGQALVAYVGIRSGWRQHRVEALAFCRGAIRFRLCFEKCPFGAGFRSGREYASILRRSDLVFAAIVNLAKSSNERRACANRAFVSLRRIHPARWGACCVTIHMVRVRKNNFGRE